MIAATKEIHWLEKSAAEVPAADDWLGGREAAILKGLRFSKRRADWRLGRWTAKHAVATYLNTANLCEIEILPATSGAPEVYLLSGPAPVSISISHREGRALCAFAASNIALGCDLEVIEPRSSAFAEDYFTPAEQGLFSGTSDANRFKTLALLWSAKESVLKALHIGLRLDTRSVMVRLDSRLIENAWHSFEGRYEARIFQGWWQQTGPYIRTIAGCAI